VSRNSKYQAAYREPPELRMRLQGW